jgi:xylitol oxidase
MGSLPHISIGGATATATHGSGSANGNLATAVRAIEFITADGDLIRTERGDPDFNGMVVHAGALGIATRLTLDIQPAFEVCQEVLEHLPWEALVDHFDEVFGSAYSVSVFTSYQEANAGVLWRKHRMEDGWELPHSNWATDPARANRHPVAELPAESCTPQLLEPGPWCHRLPHFRLDQVPASGEEIQTEYMIEIEQASEAIVALREFEPVMRESLMISEIRTIAADDLWLSTAYGRDTVAFHFSWYLDQAKVDALLPKLEDRLAPFAPRPHWGKAFALPAEALAERWPRFRDFCALRRRMDPGGKFVNPYLERAGLA